MPPSPPSLNPSDYSHSPAHFFTITRDHTSLSSLTHSLPTPLPPSQILTPSHSLSQDKIYNSISQVLDRRDVPFKDTPLHVAVKLNDAVSAQILCSGGADVTLQNSSGWSPLQEAICLKLDEVARILIRHQHASAWAKWRHRLPRVVNELRKMRDFYLEFTFHFESSVIPFISKIAPSDTYRIWKREGNLRADTTLAGFDGMKIQRADQSFLFLGDGDMDNGLPEGTLLVLNRDKNKIYDAFENAGDPLTDSDVAEVLSQSTVYRPGMDVTRAELVPRVNWRRQERKEKVGEWEAKVFDVNNVVFSFRSRKVRGGEGEKEKERGRESDFGFNSQVLPLELDEDDDGFLVAENFEIGGGGGGGGRRHSSFVRGEGREWVSVGRKSVDINFAPAPPPPRKKGGGDGRKSVDFGRGFVEARRSVDFRDNGVEARKSFDFRDNGVEGRKSVCFGDNVVEGRRSVDFRDNVVEGRRSVDFRDNVVEGRRSVDFREPVEGRKSVYYAGSVEARKSVDIRGSAFEHRKSDFSLPERRRASTATSTSTVTAALPPTPAATKEKEYVKSLRPSVWLTDQFPLKTEELLPLLDILANKVKAVRRMRELLTTKFPPGSFPVKISIPVVPTVKVVITFTKFVQLQPIELFYTPLSSPRQLGSGNNSPEEEKRSNVSISHAPSSASSWLRRSNSSRSSDKVQQQQQCTEALESDPFAIPSGYSWESISSTSHKTKKSKPARRPK